MTDVPFKTSLNIYEYAKERKISQHIRQNSEGNKHIADFQQDLGGLLKKIKDKEVGFKHICKKKKISEEVGNSKIYENHYNKFAHLLSAFLEKDLECSRISKRWNLPRNTNQLHLFCYHNRK